MFILLWHQYFGSWSHLLVLRIILVIANSLEQSFESNILSYIYSTGTWKCGLVTNFLHMYVGFSTILLGASIADTLKYKKLKALIQKSFLIFFSNFRIDIFAGLNVEEAKQIANRHNAKCRALDVTFQVNFLSVA